MGCYEASRFGNEGWIRITYDEWDTYEIDSFVTFLRGVKDMLGGNPVSIDSRDTRYTFDNDLLQMVFQWDGLFGITVVVSEKKDEADVMAMLLKVCRKLNEMSK